MRKIEKIKSKKKTYFKKCRSNKKIKNVLAICFFQKIEKLKKVIFLREKKVKKKSSQKKVKKGFDLKNGSKKEVK